MKVIGVVFSARKQGNCLSLLEYCLENFREHGYETEFLNAYDLKITPCSHCNYECFVAKECSVKDDVSEIYKKCEAADIIIFVIPTYSGHLSSIYFAFTERAQPIFKSFQECAEKFLKKINFIIIGNLSSGGDMALHEALYSFANLEFWPETVLFPAREYDRNSIKSDLIEVTEVKKRLDKFVARILEGFEK